ncbi:DeoR/GlpR family DNA-binding transcription regulator [Pseudothauera rhizosphaerae]|uniref:DeoR/GlpR transcriptional regulator n=1 Tax=Pseudothauera rhizosphaerae TaxID=2565932 RepID=A0A4S4AP51_9RHOO|nr:DeoR/GlpR family DNA-binding transcription regulator [Pseudothauera rhizosphaerae]THF61024.1 DeoR/GlpR transcriptional regulator [Pseudothauera rhizosphaerae]
MRAILDSVNAHGFQTIEALAARFGVTTQTIRRDVNLLCERGLCRRRHGGIDLPPGGENLAYPTRRVLDREAKRRIALCVARAVPDGASLFFGIGTTPEQCAHALLERKGLRVMTNNLNVAAVLARNPGCEVTVAGGRIRNGDFDVVAGEAHDFFCRFSVDIGIYGVGGVAEDGALLDFSEDEARMRGELARHCRQRFLVLDHSKFGRGATVRGGHITEATAVFTDRPPPPDITRMLAAAGVAVVFPPDDSQPTP